LVQKIGNRIGDRNANCYEFLNIFSYIFLMFKEKKRAMTCKDMIEELELLR